MGPSPQPNDPGLPQAAARPRQVEARLGKGPWVRRMGVGLLVAGLVALLGLSACREEDHVRARPSGAGTHDSGASPAPSSSAAVPGGSSAPAVEDGWAPTIHLNNGDSVPIVRDMRTMEKDGFLLRYIGLEQGIDPVLGPFDLWYGCYTSPKAAGHLVIACVKDECERVITNTAYAHFNVDLDICFGKRPKQIMYDWPGAQQ